MSRAKGWTQIEREAAGAFEGEGRLPLPAYSEFMPAPYIGIKPYAPTRADGACTAFATDDVALDVTEYEVAHELGPGRVRVAEHIAHELGKLVRGEEHALSRTLLEGNAAWPSDLADAARAGRFANEPIVMAMPLALSRTQDDKGNVRWTLFGASHDGASFAFWRSFADADAFARFAKWIGDELRVLDDDAPPFVPRGPRDAKTILTLRPFAELPHEIRAAYVAGRVTIVPHPATLLFYEHPRYRTLARKLPHATQIPLLHLFPRVEGAYKLRIPQSGWLDERDPAQHEHRVVARVARTHRWQRVERGEDVHGDGKFTDDVTVALFSNGADDLGLYGKPMARNAQIWTHEYELLLDGPHAGKKELSHAAHVTDAGGRFGYRFVFPAMRAGTREVYWHLPLVARHHGGATTMFGALGHGALLGYAGAEDLAGDHETIALAPRILARDAHEHAATLFMHERGRLSLTTCDNARKLLEMRELLGPLAPSYARALLRASKHATLDEWLASLGKHASDHAKGAALARELRACLADDADPGEPRTLAATRTRAFEEHVWRTIASLAEGEYRHKENADAVTVNAGKHGGPAARAARVEIARRRDLERLGDHLHALHRTLIAKHGMEGRAETLDHAFKWETEFDYPWSLSWAKNQTGEAHERNVVMVIPGRNRGEAIVMGDHYDTAYMEDVYEPERGGDGLRAAAAGADDNHSATTALLEAADVLLPLARDGKLERDVWLVHLTGEEFPGDSLGARALAQAAVERRLAFVAEDGSKRDCSNVRIAGAYVLDMIGHNTERDRDVFQIAPGEGAASARLALYAHRANMRWNRDCAAHPRAASARAERMKDGSVPPPPFARLPLAGEVRVEWEPRSALYNTDGQCFSDVGIPVVLFMENYDISRTGYHDTHDTMANIDLDYCAAMTAIAIESVAEAACAKTV